MAIVWCKACKALFAGMSFLDSLVLIQQNVLKTKVDYDQLKPYHTSHLQPSFLTDNSTQSSYHTGNFTQPFLPHIQLHTAFLPHRQLHTAFLPQIQLYTAVLPHRQLHTAFLPLRRLHIHNILCLLDKSEIDHVEMCSARCFN